MATRKRNIGKVAKAIPQELTTAAVTYYTKNKEMNAAKGISEKARKTLYGGMKKEGIKSFDFETNIDGKPVMLEVGIASGSREVVDAEKLFQLFEKGRITRTQLVGVLSATKADVEKLGKDIFAQVAITTNTAENAQVKPKA